MIPSTPLSTALEWLLYAQLACPWILIVILGAVDLVQRRERVSAAWGLAVLVGFAGCVWSIVPPQEASWVFGAILRSTLFHVAAISVASAQMLAVVRALRPGEPSSGGWVSWPTIVLGVVGGAALGWSATGPCVLLTPLFSGAVLTTLLGVRRGTRIDRSSGVVRVFFGFAVWAVAAGWLVLPCTFDLAAAPPLPALFGLALLSLAAAWRSQLRCALWAAFWLLLTPIASESLQPRAVENPPHSGQRHHRFSGWPSCVLEIGQDSLPMRPTTTHSWRGWPYFGRGWPQATTRFHRSCVHLVEADAPAVGFPSGHFSLWMGSESFDDHDPANIIAPTLWLRRGASTQELELELANGDRMEVARSDLQHVLEPLYTPIDPPRVRLDVDPANPWTVQEAIDLCDLVLPTKLGCHLR